MSLHVVYSTLHKCGLCGNLTAFPKARSLRARAAPAHRDPTEGDGGDLQSCLMIDPDVSVVETLKDSRYVERAASASALEHPIYCRIDRVTQRCLDFANASGLDTFDLSLFGGSCAIVHMLSLSSLSRHPGVAIAAWRSFLHVGFVFLTLYPAEATLSSR